MLTDDYVSFAIAKLLKEKGFNEIKCNTCYKWNGNFCNNRRSMSGIDNEICYQAPTLQMAMKWLRRIHGLHIAILWDCGTYIGKNTFYYHIDDMGNYENKGLNKIGFESYEEACEEAIKYCLENLI